MKFTNNLGLTKPLFNALQWDDYDAGKADYTPSSLGRPAYMAALERIHDDEIVVEASDNVWSLLGKATHKIVEIGTQNLENNFAEKRVYCEIGKWTISMKMDNLFVDAENQILEDHKTTTVYKFKPNFDGTIPDAPDWDAQLNIGAYILRHNFWFYVDKGETTREQHRPIPIKTLRINGILKDHRQTLARQDRSYPQHPLAVREFQMWPDEKLQSYVADKASEHDFAKTANIEDIPECTPDEIWATPDQWALMKHGNKKAIKLFQSTSSLAIHVTNKELSLGEKKGEHYSEFRPGERKRCEGYCNVGKNGLCPAYNSFLKENK